MERWTHRARLTVEQIDREQACRLDGEPPSIDLTDREDAHVALIPKTSVELRQRVTKRREYELYCTVSGHRRAGMRTTLTVKQGRRQGCVDLWA